MRDINCLFYMGRPWMTDFLGGVHARRVRFLGVWMSVPEALRELPDSIRMLQIVRN